MPCLTQPAATPVQRERQRAALERLAAAIGAGSVRIIVGRAGGIAFAGWRAEDREGVSDVCAYRAIMHRPEVRRALVRAEAMSGHRMDPRAVASGLHTHDGGATWGRD